MRRCYHYSPMCVCECECVFFANYSNGNCFKSNLNVWWIENAKSINWKRKNLIDVVFDKLISLICSSFHDALASRLFGTFAIIQQLFFTFKFCICLIFSYDGMSAMNSPELKLQKPDTIHKYFFFDCGWKRKMASRL